ncbi:MAG: hypothetical protein GY941_21585 [Planctomycetes bacterium]|nr:hypothetical protein [Planctomycetota bacterium]
METRGRPITNRSNNWKPEWLPLLEVAARQVLACHPNSLLEVEDLISIGWRKAMRYQTSWVWLYTKRAMSRAAASMTRSFNLDNLDKFNNPTDYQEPAYKSDNTVSDIDTLMQRFPLRHQQIAYLLSKGRTCQQVGDVMGLSGERIRQLMMELTDCPISKW